MRKKYLSALLFGALLLASAGTFTSCSDYDDDIKNLQEQINTVVSDLESLKTKVDGLGGYVTDVKIENGKLVVTANGSTVSYDLPAGGSSEVANIEIKDGHLYVNGTDKGSVGSTVTVNENGELVIDGEVSDLKVGTEVIIKDASNGMYTISIDGQTIQLPMASAAINSVELTNTPAIGYAVFSNPGATDENGGIYWAKASKDIEWKGALGNITKGDLLVGGISTVEVKVSPATFDLGSAKLTLVDSEGKEAEAEVSAVSYSDGVLVGTRAASKDGKWNLSVKPTDKATADNMATLYTNGKEKNVRYALAVDGRVVSDYSFVIDTQYGVQSISDVAYADNNLTLDGEVIAASSAMTLPVGNNTLEYKGSYCADAYFSFEDTNVELAKQYGLEANGMTIKMTQEFAASRKEIKVVLHLLGVNGSTDTEVLTLKSNATTVDGAVEAEKTTYKVAYAADKTNFETIKIDLGTLITANMTNDEIEAVDPDRITFEIADDKGTSFIVAPSTITAYNNLYVGDNKFTDDNSLAQVTSLQIPVTSIQTAAEVGSYTLVMTVKDAKGTGATEGNEIKKFNFPIDITLPAFNDLFEKSGSWNEAGDAVTLKLSNTTTPSVGFISTLTSKSFDVANQAANFTVDFEDIDDVVVNDIVALSSGVFTVNASSVDDIMKDGAYLPLTTTVTYNFGGKLDVTSDKVTVNFKSLLDGASLKNFADGKEASIKLTSASGQINAFVAASGNVKDAGLAIIVNENKYAIDDQALKAVVGGSGNDLEFTASFDSTAGQATASVKEDGSIKYDNLNAASYTTTLTVSIKEKQSGIVTKVTIPVQVAL